jgi:ATP-dependent RNA helicase DDX49/DBP8
MLHKLSENPFGVFGVILAPNRELAMQIVEKLKLYADGFRLRTALLIGGTSYLTNQSQLDQVPHIIVGTPGRV